MALPLRPPFPPMEALSVDEIPPGDDWQYEPKWDGFRCLVFRDGDKVELQSKSGPAADALFPGDRRSGRARLRPRASCSMARSWCRADGAFSFDALLQRIHPAASRVAQLAAETPALLIAFDLLADDDGTSLIARPLRGTARARCEAFRAQVLRGNRPHPALAGDDQARAKPRAGSSASAPTLDGIIAKRRDAGVPLRRPHRHAEDQELSQRGLRGRRLPLQRGQAGGRLAVARPLRRRGPAASRRLHVDHQAARTSRR